MFCQRLTIRHSVYLNKLLYDNTLGLRFLFEKNKSINNTFTLESATVIFASLSHEDYEISVKKITECFVLCMMTVIDDPDNLKKYEYLHFVEFLELFCRVAMVGLKMRDLVEYKVF